MIRKLRIKFTILAVAVVFFVLALILGTINLMNYQNVVREAQKMLDVLAKHEGRLPEEVPLLRKEPHFQIAPEARIEARYFSVEVRIDGTIRHADTGKIEVIDQEHAEEFAKKAWKASKTEGFLSGYRYRKQMIGQETMRILFLNCYSELHAFRSFLFTSIGVSLFGMLVVFFVILFVSKSVVRPFAQSYEKQKRFITDAGHEIKTPLTIIDADITVLEMETGSNEWLQDIQKQTHRLKELTEDLIFLSRMEEQHNAVQMAEFPLSEVALETAESFQALAKMKGKKFRYEIEPLLGYYGSPKEIQRLLSILLDNAIKYSNEQGCISLTVQKKGKQITIVVSNTVDTIDREQIPHLFDRFYRMDQSRNSQTGGYGIGLSIAKAIVDVHKGRITAASEDGTSLTFTIMLS